MANINLTPEEVMQLKTEIVSVLRHPMAWQESIPGRDLDGFGVKEYDWYQQYDMSGVIVTMTGSEEDFGMGYMAKSTAHIPVISKDIRIFKRDLEASRRWGTAMDLRVQRLAAARMIEDIEDHIGDTGISHPISVNALPRDTTTNMAGSDWATATNIAADVITGLNTLVAKKFLGPFKGVLTAGLKLTQAVQVGETTSPWDEWVAKQVKDGIRYTFFYQDSQAASYWDRPTDATTTSANGMYLFEPSTLGNNNFEVLTAKDYTLEDLSAGKFDPQWKLYCAKVHEIYRAYAAADVYSIDELD